MDGEELLQRYSAGERDFGSVDLRRTKIFDGIILKDAIFKGANLSGITEYRIDFTGADLSNACLEGTNIKYANLRQANLSGANLRGANLAETACSRSLYEYFQVAKVALAKFQDSATVPHLLLESEQFHGRCLIYNPQSLKSACKHDQHSRAAVFA